VNSDGEEVVFFTPEVNRVYPEAVVSSYGPQDVSVSTLNHNRYIDIKFKPSTNSTINTSSIIDSSPEFILSGEGAVNVKTNNSSVDNLGDNTFRYFITEDSFFYDREC
jgi:hypothetical protein